MDGQVARLVEDILPWFLAPGRERTYILGCFARRVTFSSQQTRACNLVLLLNAAGQVSSASHVCIVGAGLAGLTAAAMAVRAGASVTLIEQSAGPLSMQLGNFVRFIHPRILSWPERGTEVETTDLPVLNWKAASAESVAHQILDDWEHNYASAVDVITHCKVLGTSEASGGVTVRVEQAGVIRELPDAFSLVVLAVGFGWERGVEGISFRSYWSNDALHQQFPINNSRLRVLVSGTGDGGLIDTLRLKLNNFDHEKFVARIYGDDRFEDIRQAIIDIEKTIGPDQRASSLRLTQEYERLEPKIPSGIKEGIFSAIRKDVRVCLNGALDNPVDPRASALHRLTTFLIWQRDRLEYEQGEIDSVTGQPGHYRVNFAKGDRRWLVREFDECIIRHGPKPEIASFLSNQDFNKLKDDWNKQPHDPTLDPLWPIIAEHRIPIERSPGPLSKHIVAERLSESALDVIGRKHVHSISVAGSKFDPIYIVELSHTGVNDQHLPAEVYGIAVRYSKTKFVGKPPVSREDMPQFDQLSIGAPLRKANTSSERNANCSLGCFLHLDNDDVGFMTTGHADNGAFGERGDIVAWSHALFDQQSVPVGEFLAATEFAETLGEEIIFNIMDVSILKLLPDVSYTPSLPGDLSGIQIRDVVVPEIGDDVFKVGAATGITEGTITNVSLRLSLSRRSGNPTWMKGVFEVNGKNDKVFSYPGDSGSIIFKRNRDATADVVGMIFGGGGRTTYGFPLQPIMDSFRCRLFFGLSKKARLSLQSR